MIGRRTHQERSVILGYLEDGPNLITMAMNGWAEGEPAWWLNLRANPNATASWPTGHGRSKHTLHTERSGPACGPSGVKWSQS